MGSSLNVAFLPARSLLSLGPGWAALAGALAGGIPAWNAPTLLQLLLLWLLVDPMLGSVWQVVVPQQLWQQLAHPELPHLAPAGFALPYAQPDSAAGRLALWLSRYRQWWREAYWPAAGSGVLTALLAGGLALLLGALLSPALLWLVLLALALIGLAGFVAPGGGRLASVVQFLLPWGMGLLLFPDSSQLALLLGGCYWAVYLGGLRLLGGHARADWLFVLGQIAAIGLLLALKLLPGAAIAGVLLAAQLLLRTASDNPAQWLGRAQPYLTASVLAAALSLGGWGG